MVMELNTLTLTPPHGRKRIGQLANSSTLRTRVEKALTATPTVKWAIMADDYSVNVRKGRKPHWFHHFHGVAVVSKPKKTKKSLKKHIGKSKFAKRPVHLTDCDATYKTLSYFLIKPDGWRRRSYKDKKKRWNTAKERPALKPREHVEYMLMVNSLGFTKRMVLYRVSPLRKSKEVIFKILR
jgi:hypothetical protein